MNKMNATSSWSPAIDDLDLQPWQVDVWQVRLDLPAHMLERLQEFLSEEETQRAARFHFTADRNRFIAAHGCLRAVLTRYLRCLPDQFTFSVNSYGKPALNDHTLEFNLSHSSDVALIAISQERRVGIDVERIRPGISSQVIAQQYFSKFEFAELQTLPLEQKEAAFFTCWTRKEAYIKAQGLGLSLPLESFDVSLLPNEPAILRATRPDPDEARRWTLFALEIDPYHEASVAVEGEGLELRLWDWNFLSS
ncbi:MAG TPA: 4'-phosphopantetheinyl transferase superfamily protein [Anaerolineales bacterium]|nr:4'-phosphopantetheinyl transferase superfamily protein [Anaerolineales bacterium]